MIPEAEIGESAKSKDENNMSEQSLMRKTLAFSMMESSSLCTGERHPGHVNCSNLTRRANVSTVNRSVGSFDKANEVEEANTTVDNELHENLDSEQVCFKISSRENEFACCAKAIAFVMIAGMTFVFVSRELRK